MSEVEKAPRRDCDHMIDPRSKWCADCWRPIIAAVRAEERSEALEEARDALPVLWSTLSRYAKVLSRIKELADEARAELERLKNEGRKQ